MGLWEWIILIYVVGGILYAFNIPDSITWGRDDWKWAFKKVLGFVFFIPIILVGIVLHVTRDFNNHKVGYIVLILLVSFIAFGFIMGMIAGPAGPGPWQ